jgi:tRNA A37 threonylcarbamoyltransferase TsaD
LITTQASGIASDLTRAAKLCAAVSPVEFPTVLGLETSCDDTGIAIVQSAPAEVNGGALAGKVCSEFLASQFDMHAAYGGVVPRLASRAHEVNLPVGIDHVRLHSGLPDGLNSIDAVAVTSGPGLAVCLRHGFRAAVELATELGKPLIKVNHLEGHILAARMHDPSLRFPFLVLLVSGGHTMLVLAKGIGLHGYQVRSTTLDDSMGEAFDKVARMVRVGLHCDEHDGLNHDDDARMSAQFGPGSSSAIGDRVQRTLTLAESQAAGSGHDMAAVVESSHGVPIGKRRDSSETVQGHLGAALEVLARQGDASVAPLPVPLRGGGRKHRGRRCFSFAGLKSAVVRLCEQPGVDVTDKQVASCIAAAFERSAFEHVKDQLEFGIVDARRHIDEANTAMPASDASSGAGGSRLEAVVVCGGVASNTALRAVLRQRCDAHALRLVVPPPRLCTDNGAMIAWAGAEKLHHAALPGALADANWDADFSPRWGIGERQPVYLPKIRPKQSAAQERVRDSIVRRRVCAQPPNL